MSRARPTRIISLALIAVATIASAPGRDTDPKTIAGVVDPLIEQALAQEGIPGAAFAFVKDRRTVYARGYGMADRERRSAADIDRTLWPIASVTKLFTAVAALQLVDRGTLRLDEDIGRSLRRVTLPPGPAITLAHLLSHTGGLDELPRRQFDPATGPVSLADFLKTRLARYREPGRTAYSSYGIALAGVAIEDASGLAFDRFVAKNILEPCGMRSARIMQRAEDEAGVAKPYEIEDGRARPVPHEWYVTTPTSSLVATASDMARFAIMHLSDGRCGERRILSVSMARAMRTQQATIHPALPGWGYGFQLDSENGLRIAEHGGDIGGFSSLLVLLPDKASGLFIVNHGEGNDLRFRVKRALLDALYPDSQPRVVPQPKTADVERLREYAGRYRSSLACHTCKTAAGEVFELSVRSDGTIEIWGQRWVPVERDLFVRMDGERLLGFGRDVSGRPDVVSGGSWRVAERVEESLAP